ncbi:hypothetical protein CIB48_g110 [Xylaria polymorpha]|nr:hypothetical protein CIB48_g110 [Xylaria polymorpha]
MMFNTKVLLAVAALADASLAQTFPDPGCSSSIQELLLAAPTFPNSLSSAFSAQITGSGSPEGLLSNPDVYVGDVCKALAAVPSSLLPEFASWGSSLLHFASVEISSYDGIVTKCIATGAAAASITSYIHSIASSPEGLCQPTSTSAPRRRKRTIPSTGVSTTTTVPTAAAARPTGAFIGGAAVAGLLGAIALL